MIFNNITLSAFPIIFLIHGLIRTAENGPTDTYRALS